MSVVGSDFDQLKRYNLAELRDVFNERRTKDSEATEEKHAESLSNET